MRSLLAITVALAGGALIAGCAPASTDTSAPPPGRSAGGDLSTADGKKVGRVTVREIAGALRVTVDANDLPPGMHGVHLHTVGKCDAPDFMTAGAHWNPTGTMHGSMNPQGPHEGDLPNIMIGADGRGSITFEVKGGSFDALLDADSAAMVIHAAADDLKTDPSGNSGGRVACGVLVAG